MISQLGFNKILVAHDVGAQTAYSYGTAHPNNVNKLVLMDFPFPGFLPLEFGENGLWRFPFHLSGLMQTDEQIEQFKMSLVTTVQLGRMGSPDEVAKDSPYYSIK